MRITSSRFIELSSKQKNNYRKELDLILFPGEIEGQKNGLEWDAVISYFRSQQAVLELARGFYSSCIRIASGAYNGFSENVKLKYDEYHDNPTTETLISYIESAHDTSSTFTDNIVQSAIASCKSSDLIVEKLSSHIVNERGRWFKIEKNELWMHHLPQDASLIGDDTGRLFIPSGVQTYNSNTLMMDKRRQQVVNFIVNEALSFLNYVCEGSNTADSSKIRMFKTKEFGWSAIQAWQKSKLLVALSKFVLAIPDLISKVSELSAAVEDTAASKYFFLTVHRSEVPTAASGNQPVEKLESLITDTTLGCSYAQRIPENLLRYLTQTPVGEISYATTAFWLQSYYTGYWSDYDADSVSDNVIPLDKLDSLYGDNSIFSGQGRKRVNSDNILITENGDIEYIHPHDQKRIEKYYSLVNEFYSMAASANAPAIFQRNTEDAAIANLRTEEQTSRLKEIKKELKTLSAIPLAVNWNLGASIHTLVGTVAGTSVTDLSASQPLDIRSTSDILQQPIEDFIGYLTHSQNTRVDFQNLLENMFLIYWTCSNSKNTSGLQKPEKLWDSVLSELKVSNESIADSKSIRAYEYVLFSQDVENFVKKLEGSYQKFAYTLAYSFMSSLDTAGSYNRLNSSAVNAGYKNAFDAPFYLEGGQAAPLNEISTIAPYYTAVYYGMKVANLLHTWLSKQDSVPEMLATMSGILDMSHHKMSKQFMPFLTFLGNYIPNSSTIAKEALSIEKAQEAKPEDRFETLDQAVAASPSIPGAYDLTAFPHQIETLYRLDRVTEALQKTSAKNEIDSAILDISPGGGKTFILFSDAAIKMKKGLVKRPVLCVPQMVLSNWKDDPDKFTNGRFNIIEISSSLINPKSWGQSRIEELLANAPANTILVVTLEWLSRWKGGGEYKDIRFGTGTLNRYASTSVVQLFAPDYVGIDESHKIKNAGTATHKATAAIAGLPTVKFLRLASGTIVTDRPTDLVGQVKLINPYIFGQAKDFEANYKDSSGTFWRKGSAGEIRRRLSRFTSVMTYNRVEWAFMLPEADENILTVPMPNDEDFKELYEMLFRQSLENLKRAKPDIYKALIDGDESKADQIQAELQPYIQKLEQFLIDPTVVIGDDLDPKEAARLQKIIQKLPLSPKIADPENGIIALLTKHFSNEGKVNSNANKVLVFCRYKRTVRRIFKVLPPKLKARSGWLTGDGSSGDALTKFQDPKSGVDILICTEMTVNTGRNLQIASRIIRVETPWSPGELDQAMSRVMRPTPPIFDAKTKKFKPNPKKRDKIWLDWIIMSNTLEIAKFARIISKIAIKSQFDHYGKPAYDALPELPIVRMSLTTFDDFKDMGSLGATSSSSARENSYLDVYQRIKAQERKEFDIKKETELSEMIPVHTSKMPEDSFKIPFDLPAADEDGSPNLPPARPIKDLLIGPLKKIGKKWIKAVKINKPVVDVDVEIPELPIKARKERKEIPQIKESVEKQKTSNKVTDKTKRDPTEFHKKPNVLEDKKVVLNIETYNGLLTLTVDDTKDEDIHKLLSSGVGFTKHGRCVFAHMPNAVRLRNTVKALEATYKMRPSDMESIKQFETAFINGKKFSAKRSSKLDFLNFYMERRKVATDRKSLRMYAVVNDGELYLQTDVRSQPAAQDLARRRRLPNSQAVWETYDPYYVLQCKDKQELIRMVKKVKSVIGIENESDVVKQIKRLQVRDQVDKVEKEGKVKKLGKSKSIKPTTKIVRKLK